MSELITTQALAPDSGDKTMLGFWIYLMTDIVLFGSLFATYAVLRHNTFGGPSGAELFSLPAVLAETVILLTSSFTCGLAMIAAHQQKPRQVLGFLSATFLLGLSFLAIELNEFTRLAVDGNSWQRSGFLSGFFTLVGTHGLHITLGLLWMGVVIWKLTRVGLTAQTTKRLSLLAMFWHFLDVIWIFIFTIVYLLGALNI